MLIAFSDLSSLPIIETTRRHCQVIGQIVMDIDIRKAGWILMTDWIVRCIGECVYASGESDRILGNKPSRLRIVKAGAVVVEAGLGIKLTTCEGVARITAAAAVPVSLLKG